MGVGGIGVPEGLLLLLTVLLFGALTATMARRRGRRAMVWSLLGGLFGPVAMVVLIVLPPRASSGGRHPER